MFIPKHLELMGVSLNQMMGKIHQDAKTGCWVWNGPRDRQSRALIYTPPRAGKPGRSISARRLMCEFAGDKLTPGVNVRFRCGSSFCVNPEHQAKQGERRPTKVPRGSKHSRAKLTELQVEQIRARIHQGAVQAQLAREYGVSTATISYIRNGKCWADPSHAIAA